MYLHLGQNVVVPEADVIGVFDLDNTTGSFITRKFLSDAEKAGCIISVSDELPRSFVVCGKESPRRGTLSSGRTPKSSSLTASFSKGATPEGSEGDDMKVYLSQLSSQTLLKRSETARFEL